MFTLHFSTLGTCQRFKTAFAVIRILQAGSRFQVQWRTTMEAASFGEQRKPSSNVSLTKTCSFPAHALLAAYISIADSPARLFTERP